MTLYPAEIFGVAEQLGSIEKGKIANLVVTAGDLFGKETKVKHVFVDGVPFEIKRPNPLDRAAVRWRAARAAAFAVLVAPAHRVARRPHGGSLWEITINSPAGTLQGTLKLVQEGCNLSGEITTQFGTSPLKNGVINGAEIKFDYTLNVQGQQLDVAASGKITGTTMSGFDGGDGPVLDFSGTKKPN